MWDQARVQELIFDSNNYLPKDAETLLNIRLHTHTSALATTH